MSRALWMVLFVGCGRLRFGEVDATGAADADSGDASSTPMIVLGAPDGVLQDSYITACNPTLEYGGATHIHVGNVGACPVNALMRFDTASVPIGTDIVSASLRLWTHTDNASNALHTLYPILEDWSEGSSDDNGTPGAPSWNERLLGTAWTSPGCEVGSRSATSMGNFVPPLGTAVPFVVAIDVVVVQGWIDNPATNFGFSITNNDAVLASLFRTREGPESTTSPELVLTVQQ